MTGDDKGCFVAGSLHATACKGELVTCLGGAQVSDPLCSLSFFFHRSFCLLSHQQRRARVCLLVQFLFCVINFYLSIPLQCYFTRLGFLGNVHSASDPKRKRTKKVRVSFFNKFHLFCIVLSSLLSGNLGSSSRIHHGDSSNGSFTPWTLLVSASRKFYLETCQALEEGRNGLPKMLLLGIQRSCTNYIFCQAG